MKKIYKILLAICCLCQLFLSGCDEKNDLYKELDTEKAEKVALEYMNEKYGEEFSVVSSKKEYEAGYVPTSIQTYWCDVELTLKDSETMDNYIVRVTLKDNGEKPDYVIEWDNYMTSLVEPCLENQIEQVLSEKFAFDFLINIFSLSEINALPYGFTKDFFTPKKDCSLHDLSDSTILNFYCDITIPESVYNSDLKNMIRKTFKDIFFDDSINFIITTYPDDIYFELLQVINNGKKTDLNFSLYATEQERFYLNEN
ncbi:MAG: hypothetical protein ACI4UK_01780 [Floccifex sp.]